MAEASGDFGDFASAFGGNDNTQPNRLLGGGETLHLLVCNVNYDLCDFVYVCGRVCVQRVYLIVIACYLMEAAHQCMSQRSVHLNSVTFVGSKS